MIKKQQKDKYLCRNMNLKVRFIVLYKRNLRLNWRERFKCFCTMMLTSKMHQTSHYFKKYLIKLTIKCLTFRLLAKK